MSNLTFIIVDDEEIARPLYQLMCETVFPDAEFVLTDDGSYVLENIDQFCRDGNQCIMIVDDQMPKMSGMEIVRRLRDQGKTFPVVMISGSDVGEKAIENGVDLFLAKPFTVDGLKEVLKSYL